MYAFRSKLGRTRCSTSFPINLAQYSHGLARLHAKMTRSPILTAWKKIDEKNLLNKNSIETLAPQGAVIVLVVVRHCRHHHISCQRGLRARGGRSTPPDGSAAGFTTLELHRRRSPSSLTSSSSFEATSRSSHRAGRRGGGGAGSTHLVATV